MADDLKFSNYSNMKNIQNPNRFSHLILWLSALFIFIFFIWANFAKLDEVTHAEGKVIPSSQTQIIQNLEGGIVQKIYVHEGEMVQKGQELIKLDDVRFGSSYQESDKKALALKIKIARLTAEINNQPFNPSQDFAKQAPELVNSEMGLYNSHKSQLAKMQSSYSYTEKELNMTKPLVAKGAASPVEVLRLQRQASDQSSQIEDFRSKQLQELNAAKSELLSLNESLLGLKDRYNRTIITSPVKGIINQIKIKTVGGVAQPGMELMQVVPLDDKLLVEAKVKPKDIGFVRIGQPATVKITAYDYSIYGGLKGKVVEMSPDTITNEKGESFYLVRVQTEKNYLSEENKPLYIGPGMMASVDIITGHKSVLQYLMKPIFKARDEALRER